MLTAPEKLMLFGKVAIITGASRGIGRAIALRYAAHGARVMLVATTARTLQGLVDQICSNGGDAVSRAGDVADDCLPQEVVDICLARWGKVDILVNCAGVITRTPTETLSRADWQRVLDVNLTAAFSFSKAVLPHMREHGGGKIINITSQMAHMPHPSASPSYEVSKAGLTALTRHLALQYARVGVCVNAIAPGSIDTDMPKSMSAEARERLKNGVPMGRLGEPEEVADCALFFASSLSNYITGSTVGITGGSLMH
jgi:3-oxoacyl-[acyl-carrier protein] reductase